LWGKGGKIGKKRQEQKQPQIPGACGRTFGDDKQKGNGKDGMWGYQA